MVQAVVMPKLGQTVEEATIVKWHKHEGDAVKKGDVLFEIETDKAVLEAESFYDGALLKVLVQEGETVPVSSTVAYVGKKGEKAPEGGEKRKRREENIEHRTLVRHSPQGDGGSNIQRRTEERIPLTEEVKTQTAVTVPSVPSSIKYQVSSIGVPPARLFISPRARALARECVIDPANINGTGPNGRILVRDVKAYLEANAYDKIKIAPAAKKLAARENIDILRVSGTGERGRIMVRDVKRAVAEKPRTMSRMRQVIAKRLTESFTTTPHFYVTVSTDMTDLLAFRKELKERGEDYGVTDFILESVILSLQEFPVLNSVTDGTTVRWHSNVDLGMAVGLDDGLVVPVLRNAEDLSMNDLHEVAGTLAAKAQEGKLMPDEMTGSTFTVSNMGMYDVENFTAIINPGECAILAVGSAMETVVAVDGRMKVRSMMKMTLSSDHRIVDGMTAARFTNAIKNKLEDVELWRSLT